MTCLYEIMGVCFTKASGQDITTFFGFAEFIGAFALLAIVFTIADVQYRFRISVCPFPLPIITFWAIVIIGFGTLIMDLWVAQGWWVVYLPFINYGLIQGLFAAGFLMTALAWIYFAFLNPPVFSKWNSKRYFHTLSQYLVRGSDLELPVIAVEVGRSADRLIEIFVNHQADFHEQKKIQQRGERTLPNAGNYASDIMWMIGNRKFCRHVVSASPGTAIRLFQAAIKNKINDVPIGQFAKNIVSEAIKNPDSNLYHEDSQYESGLFGEIKPFIQAIFGSYELVEGLGTYFHSSPLDIDSEITRGWTPAQLEVYSRAVLTTYADMLRKKMWYQHSYSLIRAFKKFEDACWDIYKLDGVEDGDPDIHERLAISVRFVSKLVDLLERYEEKIEIRNLKPTENYFNIDIYDRVAVLMSEIIFKATAITKPWRRCWDVQHNTVWNSFFDKYQTSKTQSVIAFKLRRLIYNEIREFDKYSDFKSFKAARYLGISLNCMGFKSSGIPHRDRKIEPLKKAILKWVKKNYVSLHENHPTVAKACLMGNITYDAENMQLVKTYAPRADREPSREVFALEKPRAI